ncbi:DUF1045 domain-containing protein [Falsihalocynthiibacter sp. SS001]|uniref:DUF1045 domain-containing protein n=1 Tax=Falsihalocynthiibacter sp. SS001 TaxID=3349698 RepID=UPI0036D36A17
MFNRFGIYMTPEVESFAELGASWLGWDLAEGSAVDFPAHMAETLCVTTMVPRKYGFHGTIKPPFHLADGTTYDALVIEALRLCATLKPVTIEGLQVEQIGNFLALVPSGNLAPLADLAAAVLQELDVFRAPPSDDELSRRRKANLTPLQETNLKNWGYPYVLEAFKFHITLTGPIEPDQTSTLISMAQSHFADHLERPITIEALTLVGEAGDGRFHALHRMPLSEK